MPTKMKEIRLAVIGCVHVPFTDEDAFDWAVETIREFRPTHLRVNGDFLDCTHFGKHKTEASHRFEDELYEGGEKLKRLRQSVQRNCNIAYGLGNHEHRIWKEGGEVGPHVRKLVTNWSSEHPEWGKWRTLPYEAGKRGIELIGPYAIRHGHRIGGNSDDLEAVITAGVLGRRGIVCVRHHTHRVVGVDRVMRTSSVPEDRLWRANGGTLCDPTQMPYAMQVNSDAWGAGVFLGVVENGNWHAHVAQPPQRVRVA